MSYLILVVDDEQPICQALTGILSDEGYEVITAFNASQAIRKIKEELPDLVLLDIWLPDINGLTVLKEIKKQYPQLPVVMISGHGNVETAVKAMKLGAYDFIEKPLSWENTIPPIVNALRMSSLQEENIALKQKAFFKYELTGRSESIRIVKEQIRKVAPTNASVLIKGESGTGKELAARAIHYYSKRAHGAFVEVNCAAIPDELIESELFGYEKGAFTGAYVRKKGKFDLANGGTIFLDEIGDMSSKTQAKVLRLIQEQRFERVGGIKTVQVDVRVVAATNKNLEEEINKGNFRADLYYRLNVVPIEIPPLRERKEDIPLLLEEFLQEIARESSLGLKKITPEAIEILKQYDWPGNVRELKNIIERLVIMTSGEVITAKDIPEGIAQRKDHTGIDFFKVDSFREAKAIFEKEFLRKKLKEYKGNVSLTAQAIGLERSHLHKKMKTYGL
ncbi:MAG: sigma-54-dependent Fis family transcriptional regulator [Candidatus Omnitrophota bacterium]|nr:sigma-54 dependent transcriptional regulator [Candidatus Desulfofervidus auxilii]RKY45242.1 MAG: sigma-54-dependent Fis family transcriptional regulator [Candidatus Omnitrophota bacterium]